MDTQQPATFAESRKAPIVVGSGDLLGHSQRTKYMKIGDKVVCVDDSPCGVCGAPINLIKNQVYVAMGVSNQWPPAHYKNG